MLLKVTYVEECMLLEGDAQIHGIHKLIPADLYVKVHTCTFKIVRQPMTLGAVSEHTMLLAIDQQLR